MKIQHTWDRMETVQYIFQNGLLEDEEDEREYDGSQCFREILTIDFLLCCLSHIITPLYLVLL